MRHECLHGIHLWSCSCKGSIHRREFSFNFSFLWKLTLPPISNFSSLLWVRYKFLFSALSLPQFDRRKCFNNNSTCHSAIIKTRTYTRSERIELQLSMYKSQRVSMLDCAVISLCFSFFFFYESNLSSVPSCLRIFLSLFLSRWLIYCLLDATQQTKEDKTE